MSGTEPANLEVRGLRITYPRAGGGHIDAIEDVSLLMQPSDYVVVVGANGAGKSTLVNAVAGEVEPSAGEVRIGGDRVSDMPFRRRAQVVARVFQNPSQGVFDELTLEENLILGMLKGEAPSPFRRARTADRKRRARQLLAEYGRGLETMADQAAEALSGGQRQLVALSMAIAQVPKILLLDEHTSALDPDIARVVMERTDALIREHRLTTLMITHNMRQASRYGDRLIIMSRGQIVDDISGDMKRALGEDGLVERFRKVVADELTDRMLGSV